MTENQDHINKLLNKVEQLLKKQEDFSNEINQLREEVNQLKGISKEEKKVTEEKITAEPIVTQLPEKEERIHVDPPPVIPPPAPKKKVKSDLEKFIGENLINKIGIAITVIGVGIGAKYAIDHEMISPLTRIMLGYLVGVGLLGFAIRLKKNYDNFSAVLLGGAMAIMYFITYAAYGFYDLFPQLLAFVLMVLFTAFSVVAAINYNKQIIAHIGLVGAYAVPLLLSEGSGKVGILFTYITLINTGILVISFKKYWKPLYYTSFALTWLLYIPWYLTKYNLSEHFGLAMVFLFIFFVLFYLTFLAYKFQKNEQYTISDVILLFLNSFIFYGIGYSILTNHDVFENYLGLFTLMNAIVHFVASAIIYRKKIADRNLFFMVSGLVMIFITIAIPVQLDGNWVTLFWAGEAALLFWIGRTKNVTVYEKLSYPLMILAFISIWHDWTTSYQFQNDSTPLFNIHFLTSLLFIVAFFFINKVNLNKNYPSPLKQENKLGWLMAFIMPGILITTIYCAFRIEITSYFTQLFNASEILTDNGFGQSIQFDWDLTNFRITWVLNYSLLFLAALSFVNIKKIKLQQLGLINLVLSALAIGFFLTQGLYAISELRESYLEQSLSAYYNRGATNILIRYFSFAFVALNIFACHRYIQQDFIKINLKKGFDLLLHITILWIVSSELIHWMDMAESSQLYKLGLSILWGIYSLLLIVLGIWKKKKHLRIGAISLFGATLLKLFFYDIAGLDTIAKTVVFVSLGILLLIISFLYNKYKQFIFNDSEK